MSTGAVHLISLLYLAVMAGNIVAIAIAVSRRVKGPLQ